MTEDYCELCDLPLSQCVHGMPKPEPAPPKTPAPRRTTKTARPAGRTSAGAVTSRSTTRRFTPPEELAPLILRVLEDEGGRASADDVLAGVEIALSESGIGFRAGDEEKGPTGELRWRTAARKARKALSDEGLIVVPEPGTWSLPAH